MIVNKLLPQGYCKGVTRAIEMAFDTAKNNKKPIYMLGRIIHNSHVIDRFRKLGIIVLEDKNKTKLELLDEIKEGTVIFSAHGVSPLVYEKAKSKNLNIVDASCPMVLLVHNRIKDYLEKGYEIIYIGTKGHPECEGVLGISDKIHPIWTKEDISNLSLDNPNIYITNQTTLSKDETESMFDLLKERFNTSIIDDKICNATTIRQEAIKNQPKADLCIVVGDSLSSNTKKLKEVSLKTGTKTILIDSLQSLDKNLIKDCKTINVTSGASTPDYVTDEIIEYLKRV